MCDDCEKLKAALEASRANESKGVNLRNRAEERADVLERLNLDAIAETRAFAGQVAALREALGDLLFDCDGVFDTRQPSRHVYNRALEVKNDTSKAATAHTAAIRRAAILEAADAVASSVVLMENPYRITTTAALADQLRALAAEAKGGKP